MNWIYTRILAYASIYHDIGRENDGADEYHGYDSYQKVIEQGFLNRLADKEVGIIKELIERHAVHDAHALEAIDGDIRDEVGFLLRYFKDADNLDRVMTAAPNGYRSGAKCFLIQIINYTER